MRVPPATDPAKESVAARCGHTMTRSRADPAGESAEVRDGRNPTTKKDSRPMPRMTDHHEYDRLPDREPTAAELAAIDAEWPVISAEIALLDAEIRLLYSPPTELDRRRVRRAEHRVADAWRDRARGDSEATTPGEVA